MTPAVATAIASMQRGMADLIEAEALPSQGPATQSPPSTQPAPLPETQSTPSPATQSAPPPATQSAPSPATQSPAATADVPVSVGPVLVGPAVPGHTWSFSVGTSGNTGAIGGGILLVTCAGRIIDTITVGTTSQVHTYSGPQVVAPTSLVFQNEGPGRDCGIGMYIWDGIYQPWKTAWLYHNGMMLTDIDPSAPQPAAAVVPTRPDTPIPMTRPADIIATGLQRQANTNLEADMELVLIKVGDSMQDALNRIDPGKRPVLRLAAGTYIGDALFHDYLYRPAIFETSDPLDIPRLTMGNSAPFNGKSLFDVACAGVTQFRGLEMFHNQNFGSGGRDNICGISAEGSIPGRMDILVAGCLGYDNGNMIGRGGPETHWKIVGCVSTRNGIGGEGYSHAIYLLGAEAEITDSFFTDTQLGHDIKSRCLINKLLRNIARDGALGTSSYRMDFPDGGDCYLEDNFLDTGVNSVNGTALHFGGEVPTEFHPNSKLVLVRTTFENARAGVAIAVKNDRVDLVLPVMSGTRAFGGYTPDSIYMDGKNGPCPDTAVVYLTDRPSDPVLVAG